jgi:hypothetical protein
LVAHDGIEDGEELLMEVTEVGPWAGFDPDGHNLEAVCHDPE